jgi:hypothetical protein
MHTYQLPYRELYDRMLRYEGASLFSDLVKPWLCRQEGERRWLEEFSARPGDPIPPITDEESWRLYALSRISDLLLLSFAPPAAVPEDSWRLAKVELDEYVEVMSYFGFRRLDRSSYHPFFHEIVIVEQSSDAETHISVREEYWPGFMLGRLLFSRSGCRVAGGSDHVVKRVAENSTLYWAFARKTRPTADLSVGWGSNSQWRTGFRRDYFVGDTLFYNVDARPQDMTLDEDLSTGEQLELLRNRCFVRCDKAHVDRWPYDLRHREEA